MKFIKRLFWRGLIGSLIFLVFMFLGYMGMYLDMEYQAYKNDSPNIYRTINSIPGINNLVKWMDVEAKTDSIINWEKHKIEEDRKFWKEVDKAY